MKHFSFGLLSSPLRSQPGYADVISSARVSFPPNLLTLVLAILPLQKGPYHQQPRHRHLSSSSSGPMLQHGGGCVWERRGEGGREGVADFTCRRSFSLYLHIYRRRFCHWTRIDSRTLGTRAAVERSTGKTYVCILADHWDAENKMAAACIRKGCEIQLDAFGAS